MTNKISNIRDILKINRSRLHAQANVVAVGIGYKIIGEKRTSILSIVCSVEKKVPAAQMSSHDLIPATVDGVLTDVVQSGRIRALQSRIDRIRPAPGGVSIGHRDVTAGTLGCLVRKDGTIFILSNNHVLANSNDANLGDAILQPGVYDEGRYPEDHIADLEQFVPIMFGGAPSDCPVASVVTDSLNVAARILGSEVRLLATSKQAPENLVDAAIARPMNPSDVIGTIMDVGEIQGVGQGELGMAVKKSGRTTGLTTGTIQQVDVSVNVRYSTTKTAYFTDQLMAGQMSQGGDSGSALLDDGNNLVGLLFAGSDITTIFNRIEHVFSALGVYI